MAPTANKTTKASASDFLPIPALTHPDSDLVIIFLIGNGVVFFEPTQDAWYRITDPGPNITGPGLKVAKQSYLPQEAASPLGCQEQYQFCRGGSSSSDKLCGPLASWEDAVTGAAPFFDLTPDDALYSWTVSGSTSAASRFLWFTGVMLDLARVPSQLFIYLTQQSSSGIFSQQSLMTGVQTRLPDDQWQRDVRGWWFTWLALVQNSFVEAALGPVGNAAIMADAQLRIEPGDEAQRGMCGNQKIRSSGLFTSFSVFGLCFAYVAGGLIIVASYALEPLVGYLERRPRSGSRRGKHFEWKANDTVVMHLLLLGGQHPNGTDEVHVEHCVGGSDKDRSAEKVASIHNQLGPDYEDGLEISNSTY